MESGKYANLTLCIALIGTPMWIVLRAAPSGEPDLVSMFLFGGQQGSGFLIRSFGDDHPQAVHYAATGHLTNPAMQFPSFGAIVAKELGPSNGMPPYVIAPRWERNRQYQDSFKSAFLGPDFDPMTIPDPAAQNFQVDDLTLPKSLAPAAVENRKPFLDVIDRYYRSSLKSVEHAKMDAFRQKAWEMILTPGVRDAFDLSKESDKTKDAYGRD